MNQFAERMSRVAPSAIMALLKQAAGGGYLNLASGLPDASLFPLETLRTLADEVLTRDGTGALQYGSAEGYGPLRELVAERLRLRGFDATADQVLITSGSQQALDLAARLLLNRGDPVVLESPTYLAALQTFDSYEASYAPVPLDGEGVNEVALCETLRRLEAHRERALTFLLPNFQNPTGLTLDTLRRIQIAACLEMTGIPLLEDDAYHDLRFEGEHEPPVSSMMKSGLAMYTGTFSKTIAPGLRVGWVYSSREAIARLEQLKQITDLHSGSLTQRIVYEFCARGLLEPQIELLRNAYRAKRDLMLEALARAMPAEVRWTKPQGGMFVFVELPARLDGEQLLERALERKLMFVPGRSFYPRHPSAATVGRNTLRLNFVSPSAHEIERGITLLAELIRESA